MPWEKTIRGLFINEVKQAERDAYKQECLRLARVRGVNKAREEYKNEYESIKEVKQ